MVQEYFSLIAAGAGIVGSLGGVMIGQSMSRSWQREQWYLDRRVEEFRELLNELSNAFGVAMTMHAEVLAPPERQREFMNSHMNSLRVIRSRIFILDAVVGLNIELRWAEASAAYQRTLDVRYLSEVFSEIRFQLVEAARKSQATPRHWYRRIFKRRMKATKL